MKAPNNRTFTTYEHWRLVQTVLPTQQNSYAVKTRVIILEDFPRAIEAIQKYHYIDDYIDSENIVVAAHLILLFASEWDLKSIHKIFGYLKPDVKNY